MTTQHPNAGRPSAAAGALGRAAALRVSPGQLGAGWGELSTILTQIADRYTATVTVRCFPHASAPAPGTIHRLTGTILLDGNLLATTPEQLDIADPAHLASLAVLLGVAFHEIGHERHTPTDQRQGAPPEVVWALTQLEEPRMEARAITEYPEHQPFIRAAVHAINLAGLPDHAACRRDAATIGVLLVGRAHAGTLTDRDVTHARAIVQATLGETDSARLERLLARCVALADEDRAGLYTIARDLEDLIGDHEPPDSDSDPVPDNAHDAQGNGGRPSDQQDAAGEGDRRAPSGAPLEQIKQQLKDTATHAAQALAALDGQPGAALLAQLAQRIADQQDAAATQVPGRRTGSGIGMPSGERIPAYGNRPAIALERQARRRLAVLLARATTRVTSRQGRIVPPGRFRGQGALTQAAQRARGAPVTAHAFAARATTNTRLHQPDLHIYLDTSGSMAGCQAVLGSVIWVCANAVRDIGGRAAVSLFGDSSRLAVSNRRPARLVPDVRCAGGTAHLAQAIGLCDSDLPLTDRAKPRLAVIVSDGMWLDPHRHTQQLIAHRQAAGVALIAVGIGYPPVTHGDYATAVIDHANVHRLADVIAGELVGALTATT